MFYTIIGANFWIGSKSHEDVGQIYPSQCTFQMQANHFNKHLSASACVHMTASGQSQNPDMESAQYLTNATSFLWMGDKGTTTPIGSNYYTHQFGEQSYGFQGWTANVLHDQYGRRGCLCWDF